jgi:sporulation integral membrane protein YtvI
MKSWGKNSFKLKWFLTITLITLGVYLGFRYLLPLVLPFILAYFFAWIIRPVTELLYRKVKLPRIIGGTFALLLLVAVFGTAFCMLVNILIKQTLLFIRNIPVYINMVANELDAICQYCDGLMGLECGTIRAFADEHLIQAFNNLKSKLMPEITEHTISILIRTVEFTGIFLIIFVAAILIAKDLPEFHKRYEDNKIYRDIHKVTAKLSEAGIAYLRCQLIIMVIVAVVNVLGLSLLKNEYAFLLGIGIAILDALPILGSGLVFIPWSIVTLFQGDIYTAAILFTIYLISQVIREILEPKLIGNRIGIKPLATLVAMYIGVKLFAIAGFFLGPIGLVIIMTIYKVWSEKSEELAMNQDITYDKESGDQSL